MKPRKQPIRKCVACQEMITKKQLIRLVRTPEGTVELDLTGKKSGRGAYVHADVTCVQQARKARMFERSFKQMIESSIYEMVLAEVERISGQQVEGNGAI
jgi:predicted RNA-binding protein YlxR (DUF448 family)